MSRASAKVYFNDGTVLHGIYNGTIDVYMPKLYKNTDNVWEEFYSRYNDNIDVGYNFEYIGGEDCILYDDYGGGDYYIGKASKEDMTIHKDFLAVYKEDEKGTSYMMKSISKDQACIYLGYNIIEE